MDGIRYQNLGSGLKDVERGYAGDESGEDDEEDGAKFEVGMDVWRVA